VVLFNLDQVFSTGDIFGDFGTVLNFSMPGYEGGGSGGVFDDTNTRSLRS
jgi:hypothetical protein